MKQHLDKITEDKAERSTGSSGEKSEDGVERMSQFEFPQMQKEIDIL